MSENENENENKYAVRHLHTKSVVYRQAKGGHERGDRTGAAVARSHASSACWAVGAAYEGKR